MKSNSVKITSIIVGAVLVMFFVTLFVMEGNDLDGKTVKTTGLAEISVVPDTIALHFTVETKGETSAEASAENSEAVNNLITALVVQGSERKDIQTTSINVYEDYEWINNRRVSKGYMATHGIVVKISSDESEKTGEIIDAAVKSNSTLAYVNFELSQELENEYKAQAILLATQDAKSKAEAIAEGLDKDLGKLVSVSDSDFYYNPWRYDYATSGSSDSMILAEEAKAALVDVNPAERTISSQVVVVYRLS